MGHSPSPNWPPPQDRVEAQEAMLELLAWLVALPLAAPLAYLGVELILGLRPLPAERQLAAPARICLLVAAHNEAAGIAATVEALSAVAPGAQILVVADNCDDATAAEARKADRKSTRLNSSH